MKVPAFMQGIPRMAYVVAVPILVFAVTVAITLATSGGDSNDDTTAVTASETPSLANLDSAPTRTPTPVPTATPQPTAVPPPNRENCDEIRGTDYLSPEEREWFLANCTGGGGGGGGGGGAVAVGNAPYGGETPLGDRLIIPSIGVNAPVSSVVVPSNGVMPDPVGYFNAVWYDFSNFAGLGGYIDGNHVLAGHVDSAVYGAAVFYSVRNLGAGSTIQYVTSGGQTINYTVVHSASYPANTDFSGFVASGAADLTLITCTGSFVAGNYTDRHVIQAVRS